MDSADSCRGDGGAAAARRGRGTELLRPSWRVTRGSMGLELRSSWKCPDMERAEGFEDRRCSIRWLKIYNDVDGPVDLLCSRG
jgi:hypothetical protein